MLCPLTYRLSLFFSLSLYRNLNQRSSAILNLRIQSLANGCLNPPLANTASKNVELSAYTKDYTVDNDILISRRFYV